MKKPCVAKISQGIWERERERERERVLYENNCNCNSYKYSHKFAFTLCLSFCRNQKQESIVEQVGDLVTRHNSVFCLHDSTNWMVALK